MEKKCPSCGLYVNSKSNFCKECGHDFSVCSSLEILTNDDEIISRSNLDFNKQKENEIELSSEYISIEVDGVIDGANYIQQFSSKQEEEVSLLEIKKESVLEKENKRTHKNKIIKTIWIIFCGVFNAIYLSIFGVIECFSLIGIPFGIVLFKMIPLAFNPIGKRVKLNFYKRPFFNLIWLLFGGWFIATIYYMYILFLYITVIGIPYALQMKKVAKYLWAPFGAQVLNENEFSEPLVEKEAYTIQYLRHKRIIVDASNIDFSEKEKTFVEKIYKVDEPVNNLFQKRGKVAKIALGIIVGLIVFSILKNNFVIIVDLIVFGITKGNEPQGILAIIRTIVNFSFINFAWGLIVKIMSPIEVELSSYLNNIPYFNVVKIYIPMIVFLIINGLIVYGIVKANNKKQERLEEIDFGYATRKQLIEYYDCGNKLIPEAEEAILKIYVEYRVDVEKEIEMNKEV